jgi:hypothetical protein
MMRASRIGLAAAVFLWLPCAAAAQMPGQTAPPPPPPPVGETPQPGQVMQPGQLPVDVLGMTELVPDRRPPSWVYSVGVDEAYESNPQGTPGSGASDTRTRVEGSISHGWTLRRGSAGLSGSANEVYYTSGNGPDSFNYGLGFGIGYAFTHRLSWHAGESLSSVMSLDSAVLTGSGIVSPNVQTRTNVASTGVAYQASPKVQVDVSAAETTVVFPGGELSNGSSLTLQGRVTRQLGRDQMVGVSVGNTFSTGQTGDIQGILGLWQWTIGRLTLHASGGVRPYKLYGEPGTKYAPGGSFAVNKRLIRGQSFSGSYEYAVEQAFGFNRTHLAHRFNAGYAQAVGRRLNVEGAVSYGLNTYPQIPNYHLGGWTAALNARYVVAPQLSIGADYGFWNHFETGVPQFNNYRAGVFLSYRGAFR